jgi:hypothetical protein
MRPSTNWIRSSEYTIDLKFLRMNDIIYLTIPAKPLNDAQIGGLLFYCDSHTTPTHKTYPEETLYLCSNERITKKVST